MNEKFKYRLLVVAPNSVHLRNFLKRIEGQTSAIHVITSSENSSSYPETVVDFSFKKIQNYIFNPKKIRKIFREFKPDLVHIHQLNSVAFFTLLGLKDQGVPVVATAWGSDVLLASARGGFLKWVLKYNLKNCDAFTSDSGEVEECMRSLVKRELSITQCNYGAEAPETKMAKENIVYSNRLHHPIYRIDKVIESFKSFRAKYAEANWRLIIAGTGTETENLKKLTGNLELENAVEFQGWVEKEQNQENYAKAKIWISIPESDATPISMLEAMYHGCYPVVSDLKSLREWIDDGRNGTLVADVNSDFLSELDLDRINDSATENRKLVERKGSSEAATRCFSGLHRSLIKRFARE